MSRTSWAACVVCVCVITTACGGSSTSGHTPPDAEQATSRAATPSGHRNRSACELISADEASAIVGSPLTTNERSGGPTSSSCYFAPTGRDTQEFVLKVTWSGGREAWHAQEHATALSGKLLDGDRTGANSIMKSDVGGLGDQSSYNPILGAYVLKGDVLLEFNNLLTLRDPKVTWGKLAKKALERL